MEFIMRVLNVKLTVAAYLIEAPIAISLFLGCRCLETAP